MLQTLLSPEVIARLPTPKGVAMALTQACQRENVNLDTIANLVRTDSALSGRILALANSCGIRGIRSRQLMRPSSGWALRQSARLHWPFH